MWNVAGLGRSGRRPTRKSGVEGEGEVGCGRKGKMSTGDSGGDSRKIRERASDQGTISFLSQTLNARISCPPFAVLSQLRCLRYLDFGNNELFTDGAVALCTGLKY